MDVYTDVNYASKYVIFLNIFNKNFTGDMNKCTLFLVFICGAGFAGLVSVLKSSLNLDDIFAGQYRSVAVGILPPDSDLALMDDGYIAMAKLGPYPERITSHETHIKRSNGRSVTDLEERSSEVEALNSLKVAVELFAAGKNARAGRLLEHAHSLAPRHHEVLLTYGEYLEKHRSDIVQADLMFLKALTLSPASSRALQNRRRTQPIVEKIDTSFLSRIDNKRDQLAMIPSLSGPLRRIKKEAYFHHIFHTAAIEGNTLTLAQIRMILETGLSVGGKSIIEHNEILGLDLALKYINTTLVHRVGKITLSDILQIHRRVLGHVDPIEAGLLRTTQVFVSDHVPPPPTKLQILMEEFLSWLNSPESQKLHPIKYAALAHYKLVFIHPFVDGNGRTARLLMNFLLMQAGFPPVIIRKQDRSHYYNHLQTANDGDTRPFVRFIAHCTEKTLDVYLWATKDRLPEIEQVNSNLNEMHSGKISTEPLRSSTQKLDSDESLNLANSKTYTTSKQDLNNNIHTLPDEDEDDKYEFQNRGYTNIDDIETHLWLNGHEEKVIENGRSNRVLDENDIYETIYDIRRIQMAKNSNVIDQETSMPNNNERSSSTGQSS